MARSTLVAILAAVTVAQTAIAHADPEPTREQSAQKDALALYNEGLRHFNLGEYGEAIPKFRQAYLLTSAPELLFNIAQSYRLSGPAGCQQAAQFYRSFLRVAPSGPKRVIAETALKDVQQCPSDATPDAPAPASPPAPAPAPAPASPPAPAKRTLLPAVLGGSGLTLALGGGALVLWAKVRYDAVASSGCSPACDPSRIEGPRTGAVVGDVLLAAGSVAMVGAVVVWFASSNGRRASLASALEAGITGMRF